MDITIDFETRSKVPIQDGVYRYARDISTSVICMAYKIDDEPTELWTEFMPPPVKFLHLVESSTAILHAWNAQFEIEIWQEVLHERYGWIEVPPLIRWRDTAAEAGVAGYPQSLDAACIHLGVKPKDRIGKSLITKLSKPISAGKLKGTFRPYEGNEQAYQDMYRYCIGDVESEREAHHVVGSCMTDEEYEVWRSVVTMNQRGLPIDVYNVGLISDMVDRSLEANNAVLNVITGGEISKATQVQAITRYLVKNGTPIENLQEDTVNNKIAELELKDTTGQEAINKKVLQNRREVGKVSVAKLKKIKKMLCEDGTVKGNLKYYGAGPGRHSGQGMQPQNLPRFTVDNPDEVLRVFNEANFDVLNIMYNIVGVAVGLIRPMIKAQAGMKLMVSDFSQVEAICIPWLLNEESLLRSIREGKDIYRAQSSDMYSTAYDSVTTMQRQAGKIAVLACGFAGGAMVFVEFAAGYGLKFTQEEAKDIVKMFRTSRPKVVRAWPSFTDAAILAMQMKGKTVAVEMTEKVKFQLVGKSLTMILPSGRRIYYPQARIVRGPNRWGNITTRVEVGHTNSYTKKWEVREMTGALLFQNAVQGTCRDLLVQAQIRLERSGYMQVGSIHDEAVAHVPDSPDYTIENFDSIMSTVPMWASGFPLKCKGYESYRYRK